MRFKTRARTSIRVGGAVFVGASLVAAVAASSISTAAASVPTVKISVASLIPGSTAAATAAFNSQVQQFEKANPGIQVTSVQYQWLGSTFAAKLAAGTLPTVFTVPFTDGRALGDNGQLANLTKYAKALPYFNKFNPAVIAEGIDAKGQVIALPTASYAQALSYNRHLFSEAGLNPDDPPTTWAQLEADAKQISEKTGMAGYAEMGANDNTAGWILTTLDYALGGRMETGIGSKAKATFDNPQAVQALKMLNTMRWQDNSMGSDFDWGWSDINQAFAAGQVGMFISGSDVYTNMVQSYNINPTIYGLAPIPLANNKNAGVLGGGTLAAVSPSATQAQIAAAVKWIDYYYLQRYVNQQQAIRYSRTQAADGQPVGTPEVPIFNQKQENLYDKWILPFVNVPLSQMAPFTSAIFNDQIIPEPESATQAVYGDLDSVVEAVLTQQGSNPSSLLSARQLRWPEINSARIVRAWLIGPGWSRWYSVTTRASGRRPRRHDVDDDHPHSTPDQEQTGPVPAKRAPFVVAGRGYFRRRLLTWVRRGGISRLLFLLPMLIVFGAFSWYPIVRLVLMAFQHTNLVQPPTWVGFQNFSEVIHDPLFPIAVRNTAEFAGLALIFGYPIPLVAAVLISEVRKRRGLYSVLAYLPVVIPPVVAVLLWKFFYDAGPTGVFNTMLHWIGIGPQPWIQSERWAMPSLVLESTWANAGGTVIIYLAALTGVNSELYEAASTDGAGLWKKVWHVTLPQMRTILLVTMILQIIGTAQVFLEPYLFTSGGPNNATITVLLLIYNYAFGNSLGASYGEAAALSLMLVAFLAVFSLIYLRATRSWSSS